MADRVRSLKRPSSGDSSDEKKEKRQIGYKTFEKWQCSITASLRPLRGCVVKRKVLHVLSHCCGAMFVGCMKGRFAVRRIFRECGLRVQQITGPAMF